MTNITKYKKGILIIVLFLIIGTTLTVYFTWFLSPSETQEQEEEEIVAQPTISEAMKAGTVGEIEEGKTLEEVNPVAMTNPIRPPDTPMPAAVFDTKGEIILIENNAITVTGSGENFEDQKARELKVKFTSQTITFEKGQQVRYVGPEGLKHLEIGQTILISSPENIRGKTEFTATYINKI